MSSSPFKLFLFRHGETEWAAIGRHTGRTDLPLTEKGRQQAIALKAFTDKVTFSQVIVSPLKRARETAELAGFGDTANVCPDLQEMHYGNYEGLTTVQIREQVPNWTVWTHPCIGGESLDNCAARVKNVLTLAKETEGNVALFAHGHILRILTATWLNLPPSEGKHFMLDTCTASILSYERETPAIKLWNAPADLSSLLY